MRTCLAVSIAERDAVAELAADRLWSLGAVAIEERDDTLVAGFVDDDAVRAACAVLTDDGRWSVRVVELPDGWRDDFLRSPPTTVAVGDGIVLDIDPGRVFGDGEHPTTRMALDVLADRVRPRDLVLDVGCGSGILAVAAARLGAARVVAVDRDPEAVAVTLANAERNGVTDAVVASTTSVADVSGMFDVVVANLGGRVVVEVLAPVLAARTARPGGTLVVGGLLDDERPPPAVPGLAVAHVVRRRGWATIVYS